MFCKECDHDWSQTIIVGVEMSVFNAFLKTLTCPKCGNRKGGTLMTGRKPKKGK